MASEQQTEATPLGRLTARVPGLVQETGHDEMWGVPLGDASAAPVQVVLQKFLRANSGDAAAAEKQFREALVWREKVQPLKLVDRVFERARFGDLGFVTVHGDEGSGRELVVTWNIYGAVKDNKATFGNVQEFIKWRAALMELSIQKLHLNAISEPLPSSQDKDDPYRMVQVHDYQSVSFFRMDPLVKAASRETIQTFSTAYPELLSHKYFVNVPSLMGWVFGAMKIFLSPATMRKFHPMASGTALATELKSVAASLPIEYGGKGPSVKQGETVKLGDAPQAAGADADAAAASGPTEKAAAAATSGPAESAAAPVLAPAAAEPVAAEAPALTYDQETSAVTHKTPVPTAAYETEKEVGTPATVEPDVVEPYSSSAPAADADAVATSTASHGTQVEQPSAEMQSVTKAVDEVKLGDESKTASHDAAGAAVNETASH